MVKLQKSLMVIMTRNINNLNLTNISLFWTEQNSVLGFLFLTYTGD